MSVGKIVATTTMLLGACAVLWGMRSTTPNYNRLLAPIESRGEAGNFVRGRTIALRVDGVDLARRLQGRCLNGMTTFDTGGIWIIVHATATAVKGPERVAATAIEDPAGTRYLQSDRPSMCAELLSEMTLQPDVPTSGDLIFELPADALADAELVATAAPFGFGPLDSQLRIRLGIDAADVTQRLASIRNVYELRKR
jgi:hypothetical protein